MSEVIRTFFEAWEEQSDEQRLEILKCSVGKAVTYDDPRTDDTLHGIEALNAYLGMFSSNAPGWFAKALKIDEISNVSRVLAGFSGIGPDGSEHTQYGQYFIEHDAGRISRMVGFAGLGNPE
jgi:hypothetical protein